MIMTMIVILQFSMKHHENEKISGSFGMSGKGLNQRFYQ